jgi:ATP-dependent RNA helicase DDX35
VRRLPSPTSAVCSRRARRYSVVMVDEAHERTVATEILLGLLKKVRRSRPDLRIIISSATIDAETFYKHFHTSEFPATIMSVTGIRMFPIDILYLAQPCSDYVKAAVRTVTQIHLNEAPGDVLVFMTGQVNASAPALPSLWV